MIDKNTVVLAGIVFAFILLDFVSGTLGAIIKHRWKSRKMREGLLHKCGILLCLGLGLAINVAQYYIDIGVSVPAYQCIAGYIILMEIGSVLENLCKIDPAICPEKIKRMLGVDDAGN